MEPFSAPSDTLGTEVIWVVAKRGDKVLGLDVVEEEFGTGIMDSDNVIHEWGTYGEKLSWTLRRFFPAAG